MVAYEGNDPFVITTKIANFDVKSVLIDDGSVVEVISLNAFQANPIYGFANQPIKVIGQVTLPVMLG